MEAIYDCYVSHGYFPIPLIPGDKRPSIRWSDLTSPPFISSYPSGGNIGLLTGRRGGIVVVDCECWDDAEYLAAMVMAPTIRVRTRRGCHLYYSAPAMAVGNRAGVRIDGCRLPFDVRGDGGLVVAPPSMVGGVQYRGCFDVLPRADALPQFDSSWLPGRPSPLPRKQLRGLVVPAPLVVDAATRARNYISCIHAITGCGGHSNTWRAACHLAEAGLPYDVASSLLSAWNQTNCRPPWSEQELAHKLDDAYGRDIADGRQMQ